MSISTNKNCGGLVKEIIAAPTDEVGMPLPIYLPYPPPDDKEGWNRHHAFYEEKYYLHGTEAFRAVRFSRLQWAPISLHNRFHTMYRGGVETPDSDYEAFKLTILGYAGYIPEFAVDVRKEEPIVGISRMQLRRLREEGILVTEESKIKSNVIGEFLIEYAIRNGIDNVPHKLISKFMDSSERSDRIEKGLELIEYAAEAASEPFELIYKAAKKRRAFKNQAASCPQRVVKMHMRDRMTTFPKILETELELIAA